jgi:hypothetical protein
VRLDHLLSKEQAGPRCWGQQAPRAASVVAVGVLDGADTGAVEAGVGRVRREASCWVLRQQPVRVGVLVWPGAPWAPWCGSAGWPGWWPGVGVGWLLVEMCIVGVSIFVVKLSRADGGCLGTRGR